VQTRLQIGADLGVLGHDRPMRDPPGPPAGGVAEAIVEWQAGVVEAQETPA
jgi:hypothetical protein